MKLSVHIALPLLILSAISVISRGQEDTRQHPYRYLIPKGYVGWVRVDFNVPGASALPLEDDYHVIRIPPTGRLQTSTDDGQGIIKDQYLYVCGDVKTRLNINQGSGRSMIWGNFQGPSFISENTPYKYRYFFAGPEAEYRKHEYGGETRASLDTEDDGYPKVGAKNILPCDSR